MNSKIIEIKKNKTKILSIMEVICFNGFYLGLQGFIMLSLAMYFHVSIFFISILIVLPTAGQCLQLFTNIVKRVLKTRRKTLLVMGTLSRISIIFLPIAIYFDYRNPYIFIFVVSIYSLFSPFVGSVWMIIMMEIINKEERGSYFGKRNFFSSMSVGLYMLLYGYLLDISNQRQGYFLLTLAMAIFSLFTLVLFFYHYVPEIENENEVKLSFKEVLKDKNFMVYLRYVSIWVFTWEFIKPSFEYYRVKILGANPVFLSQVGAITSVLLMTMYMIYGKASDRYGNRRVLEIGAKLTIIYVLCYIFMTPDNYKPMILTIGIIEGIAFAAINICFFNLLLEVSKKPADVYIALYVIINGIVALFAGILSGIFATFFSANYIMIFGEKFYLIKIIFIIGLFLRIFSIYQLSKIEVFYKRINYKNVILKSPKYIRDGLGNVIRTRVEKQKNRKE